MAKEKRKVIAKSLDSLTNQLTTRVCAFVISELNKRNPSGEIAFKPQHHEDNSSSIEFDGVIYKFRFNREKNGNFFDLEAYTKDGIDFSGDIERTYSNSFIDNTSLYLSKVDIWLGKNTLYVKGKLKPSCLYEKNETNFFQDVLEYAVRHSMTISRKLATKSD